MPDDCLQVLQRHALAATDCVLVTVVHTAASAPRAAGARMVVNADRAFGTIGGGNLEHNAIRQAQSLLQKKTTECRTNFLEVYALGPMLEQCCGGVVILHYEFVGAENSDWLMPLLELQRKTGKAVIVTRSGSLRANAVAQGKWLVTEHESCGGPGELQSDALQRARRLLQKNTALPHTCLYSLKTSKGALPDIDDVLIFDVLQACDFHVVIYGAGHVGRAIVSILESAVDCQVHWVDSRANILPTDLSEKVHCYANSAPTSTVAEMPANACFLVMTHSHALDLSLCEAILQRGRFQFLGLIGSQTKQKRFHKRLQEKGFSESTLTGLCCPIGVQGIQSKEPGSIAVSVVAQLLQLREAAVADVKGAGSGELDNIFSLLSAN